jgi:hypothetical protein
MALPMIAIAVLSTEEQVRIVAILDAFDALGNDLSSGLPTEIARTPAGGTRALLRRGLNCLRGCIGRICQCKPWRDAHADPQCGAD